MDSEYKICLTICLITLDIKNSQILKRYIKTDCRNKRLAAIALGNLTKASIKVFVKALPCLVFLIIQKRFCKRL